MFTATQKIIRTDGLKYGQTRKNNENREVKLS